MPEGNEQILKREMPYSSEAERAVLASILMDKDQVYVAQDYLTPEDFYNKGNGAIFRAVCELTDAGKEIDLVMVQNRLREMGMPPEVCSMDFLRDLPGDVYSTFHVESYCKIVADRSLLRKLIRVSDQISGECFDGKDDTEAILEMAEKQIFELTQKRNTGEFVPIRKIVANAMDRIEMASRMSGNVTGVPSGFIDLDYKTAGFQNSDLILIAARPSMGKTAFVLNIAEYACMHENNTVAIFSLEMSKEQLVNRLLAMDSKVDAQKLRSGSLTDDDWDSLIESAGRIGTSRLIIDNTPGMTFSELRSKCRKFKMEHDMKLVIIDYLQLMRGNGKSDSRQQEISEISRSLKALAIELDVPVIALSQLSRAVETRPDKRPVLSDLRESGAIEQDADVVMFIYRDEYYTKEKSEEKGIAQVIIGKQRNGPLGTVKLVWLQEYTRFMNMDHSQRNLQDDGE
ncbi:MAG: replicative DNA helicase [Lachnospiraceae bacterium]|nr:replicative DNA helicase [Lachnospiraceae bacterium]